ncbi:MAG TPA: YheU family protein [Tepidisphaeraceae bacterium]|nr:YheU family protein [Tepidisphaeraceae bacterium]
MAIIVIPHQQLQSSTLQALIEEFVTRDGAVHGHADILLSRQVDAVRAQIQSGQVVIVFDEDSESCTIVPHDQLPRP